MSETELTANKPLGDEPQFVEPEYEMSSEPIDEMWDDDDD